MTKSLLSLMCITIFLTGGRYPLYTLSGQLWEPVETKTYLAMYYNSNNCHECVDELWTYISNTCFRDSSYIPLIIAMPSDIAHMRQETSYLTERFGDDITIVYDNPPNPKDSFFHKKKIKAFPCLLVIRNGNPPKYYSYRELFASRKTPLQGK